MRRDNAMLLDTLRALRAKGNTVVVVEHDEETIRSAEHIVDLGPGAGVNGGRVVAHGPIGRVLASRESPDRAPSRLPPGPPAARHPVTGAHEGAGTAPVDTGRPPEQPARRRRRPAAGAARVRDGGERQRQEQPGARRAAREPRGGAAAPAGRAGEVDRVPGDSGLRGGEARAGGRSDPHRQDPPLVPRHLRRDLGPHPPPLRGRDRVAHPRLRREPLLVQRRRRTLRRMRRPGDAAHRDELPARRAGAVRRLPQGGGSRRRRWRSATST